MQYYQVQCQVTTVGFGGCGESFPVGSNSGAGGALACFSARRPFLAP